MGYLEDTGRGKKAAPKPKAKKKPAKKKASK